MAQVQIIELREQDVEIVLKNLTRLLSEIEDKKVRKKIMSAAARPVEKAAKSTNAFLDSKRPHKRYLASGKLAATYFPGNLRRSLRMLTHLKRAINIVIGPFIPDNPRGDFKGRKVDGYYAQMIFGSARAFGEKVMQKALQQGQGEAISIAKREINTLVPKLGKKYGFS